MAGRSDAGSVRKDSIGILRACAVCGSVSAYTKCKIIIKFNCPLLTFNWGSEIIGVMWGNANRRCQEAVFHIKRGSMPLLRQYINRYLLKEDIVCQQKRIIQFPKSVPAR